jgi:hypothetical protein
MFPWKTSNLSAITQGSDIFIRFGGSESRDNLIFVPGVRSKEAVVSRHTGRPTLTSITGISFSCLKRARVWWEFSMPNCGVITWRQFSCQEWNSYVWRAPRGNIKNRKVIFIVQWSGLCCDGLLQLVWYSLWPALISCSPNFTVQHLHCPTVRVPSSSALFTISFSSGSQNFSDRNAYWLRQRNYSFRIIRSTGVH